MESESKVYKSGYGRDNLKEETESLLPRKPTDQTEAPDFEPESTSIMIGEDDNAGSIEMTDKPKQEEDVSYQNTTSYGSIAPGPLAQNETPASTSTPEASSGDAATSGREEKTKDVEKGKDPSAKPTEKQRLCWLDHAKLLFMYQVFVGHAIQLVGPMIVCKGWTDFPDWVWGLNGWFTWSQMHMNGFMFISGLFASERISHDALVKNFVVLIISPFLFTVFWNFATRPYLDMLSLEGVNHGFYIGSRMYQSMEPWFLKALFVLKLSLWIFGQLKTLPLFCLVTAAHAIFHMWYMWDIWGYSDMTVMYMVGRYCWVFYMGYLCKRHKLVEPTAKFLRERWYVRAAGLALTLLLGGYAMYYGRTFQVGRNIMGFNPPTGKHPRGDPLNKYFVASPIAKLVHAGYEKVWVAVYVGAYLSWLPLDHVPILSDAGKGTLFAYLANQEATFMIMVISYWLVEVHKVTTGMWVFTMLVVPMLPTYILTHPWVSYVFWPITNPTWTFPYLLGKPDLPFCTDKYYLKDGFKKWAMWFALFAVLDQAFHTYNPEYLGQLQKNFHKPCGA